MLPATGGDLNPPSVEISELTDRSKLGVSVGAGLYFAEHRVSNLDSISTMGNCVGRCNALLTLQ